MSRVITSRRWTKIRIVWKRDEFGFPSFWQLQIAGSVALYLLDLVSLFPYRHLDELWNQTIFCGVILLASPMLRLACRSVLRRPRPWISAEIHAFGWATASAVVAAFVTELVKSHSLHPEWPNLLDSWLAFSVLFFLWCTLYLSIKQWQQAALERAQVARDRERLVQAESEAREARLSSLRYQLNPHFLFNSLNAVSTLILAGKSTAATRMLAQIGEMLRTTLDSKQLLEIPLAQEIAFVQQYLAIEQTRLGNRLRIEMQIAPETLDAIVPTMLLQPLVENAVRHGVALSVDGGTIQVESKVQNDRLRMSITNSLRGAVYQLPQASPSKGIGLTNTAERLSVLYGKDYLFTFRPSEDGYYRVTIEIPLRKTTSDIEGILCAR